MIPAVQYLGTAAVVGTAVLFVLGIVLGLAYKRYWESAYQVSRNHRCPPRHETQEELARKVSSHKDLPESLEPEKKESLDSQLDVLSQKLAEKESKLRVSKSRIRETQQVIDSIPQSVDADVRTKYQDIMNNLKYDLQYNETECKKIQEEIEWISRKRAELKSDVRQGQQLYSLAAAELAYNLTELQKGKVSEIPTQSLSSLRQRAGSQILSNYRPSVTGSIIVKSVSGSEPSSEVAF